MISLLLQLALWIAVAVCLLLSIFYVYTDRLNWATLMMVLAVFNLVAASHNLPKSSCQPSPATDTMVAPAPPTIVRF